MDRKVITASRLNTVIFHHWRLDSGRFVIFLAVFLSVTRLYFAKLLEGKQPTLKIIHLNLLICLAKDLKWNLDSLSREDELFKHSAVSEFCCSLCFPCGKKLTSRQVLFSFQRDSWKNSKLNLVSQWKSKMKWAWF